MHPWAMAIGVAAAAMPLLIHWLTRPRPVRMPLSTLRFVREAIRQSRSWHRLRDWVLLTLRTLAVLLLAAAIARPQWGARPQVSDLEGGEAVRVVVLDVSQSMAAASGAVQQIERARTVAAGYLRYRPGLAANLILAGARPQGVFEAPSSNFEALRDELARCQVRPEEMDANRALDLAARMLAPHGPKDQRRRELVLVSDFQRCTWAKADFSPLPADAHIQFEPTAPAKPPANLAIVRVEGRAAGQSGGAELEVEVANFSDSPRKVTVEASVGDKVWRLTGAVPVGGRTTLAEEIGTIPPGWQAGEARLVGVDDALAADNVRPLVFEVRPRPTYVLLTRQAVGRKATSSLFLECALAPAARRGRDGRQQPASGPQSDFPGAASPIVVRVDPAALDRPLVTAAQLIVLDHPGKLGDETVKLLADLLHRGRPILYVAAESIDATNLKRLGQSAGAGLQMPVEFMPPPAGQPRRDLVLASVRRDAAPFGVFGDNLTPVLGRLRFAGGLASRRLDGGLESDVLASYHDGSAGIVFTASDAGALAVINADLAASNLSRSGAFVPLLSELVGLLLERRSGPDMSPCGEPLVAQLPAEAGAAAGLRLRGPRDAATASGDNRYGELVDEAVGATWRWATPGPPGVYRVERDGATVFAKAVGIPAEESQLDPLSAEVLIDRLAAGHNAAYHGVAEEGQHRDDFWKWFAVACVVCVLGETSALLFFRT